MPPVYTLNHGNSRGREGLSPVWAKIKSRTGTTTVENGIKLPQKTKYDPAIPLLGIYPEKTIIQKDTGTSMFTTALFTIAKTWKQPKCHPERTG